MVPIPALFVLLLIAVWLVVILVVGPLHLLYFARRKWRNALWRRRR